MRVYFKLFIIHSISQLFYSKRSYCGHYIFIVLRENNDARNEQIIFIH